MILCCFPETTSVYLFPLKFLLTSTGDVTDRRFSGRRAQPELTTAGQLAKLQPLTPTKLRKYTGYS